MRALRISCRRFAIPMQHATSCLPEAAPLCRDAYLRAKNYHIITLPHHHYLLIYRMEERIVYVVGFFHMRENYRDKL